MVFRLLENAFVSQKIESLLERGDNPEKKGELPLILLLYSSIAFILSLSLSVSLCLSLSVSLSLSLSLCVCVREGWEAGNKVSFPTFWFLHLGSSFQLTMQDSHPSLYSIKPLHYLYISDTF